MMDRRFLLTMFGKSVVAGAAWLHLDLAGSPLLKAFAGIVPAVPDEAQSKFDAQLQADMTRLATRVYSEEGIAMILGVEDLTAKKPVLPASTVMNAAIAPAFHKYVEGWQRLHPDAPIGDAAKLVELLAYKDFAGGGKDTNL